VVEPTESSHPAPVRDPLLDDPLFAELVEAKPLPDLKLEPVTPPPPPVAVPVEALPVTAEVQTPRATPVERPRPRPVTPAPSRRSEFPPPRRDEEPPTEARPRVLAACSVLGCFGLGLFSALGFMAYAAIVLLSGIVDPQGGASNDDADRPKPVTATQFPLNRGTVALNGTVDAVGRAAGGRYLLLRTSRKHSLSVFDPVEGKVIHVIDLGEPRALFAGSASKLFVYRPQATGAELERWDLLTGRREETAAKPAGLAQPDALVVGAGVEGPVYLITAPTNGQAKISVVDPDTLQQYGPVHPVAGWKGADRMHVRASDDGNTLAAASQTGAQIIRFPNPQTREPVLVSLSGPARLATPAREGQLIYTSLGLFDAAGGQKEGPRAYTFPTAQGTDLFLTQVRRAAGTLTEEVRLHPVATPDEFVTLDDVKGTLGTRIDEIPDVPADQRVHLWPAAGLAAVLTTGSDSQLVLTKVDVPGLLKTMGNPYLVVGSDPPRWVTRGDTWRYRPVVWTDEDATPVWTVVEGPSGMLVARNGEVSWAPGPDAKRENPVRIRATIGAQHTEQRFRIVALDRSDNN
jgi:hypothetical protein